MEKMSKPLNIGSPVFLLGFELSNPPNAAVILYPADYAKNVMFWDRIKVDSRELFKRENESSTEESVQSVDWATTHACMNNLYKNKLHNKACTIITIITISTGGRSFMDIIFHLMKWLPSLICAISWPYMCLLVGKWNGCYQQNPVSSVLWPSSSN